MASDRGVRGAGQERPSPISAQDELTWIAISDFTPGIISQSALSYQTVGETPNTGPVPGNHPGQAQSAVGCIALPNGGLAPLPGIVQTIAPNDSPPATTFTNGLFVTGNPFFFDGTPGDEIVYGAETRTAGNRLFKLNSIKWQGGNTVYARTNLVNMGTATDLSTSAAIWSSITGGMTAANPTATSVGYPLWALSYWYFASAGTNPDIDGEPMVWLYPDPTAPGVTTTPYPLQDGATGGNAAICVTHQNRIVLINAAFYPWGTATDKLLVHEFFCYTDPPNGTALGAQDEVFVAEHPTGVGAWGSISAGELFVVKNAGGGYIVSGDLNTPYITRLPGVMSTYGITSRAADTILGLVYASNNRGLWVWNGSNASQKLSNQLDDNFFVHSSLISGDMIDGPSVDICAWGDWIICTNDWLYDTNTGGWWKLPPGTTDAHLWYQVNWDGNTLYAAPPFPTAACLVDLYGRQGAVSTWSWKSYPTRLATSMANRPYSV
ncbi:MAG TPA: hypothetical protein VNF73_01295, partial [Candidatus Saccharimonadales bacterium]|nr:hypothetical protein [Candidatus Saccharimonadales bacterium]